MCRLLMDFSGRIELVVFYYGADRVESPRSLVCGFESPVIAGRGPTSHGGTTWPSILPE